MATSTTPIPGPRGLPLVGNLMDIDLSDSLTSFKKFADQYGEIYRLNIAGLNFVAVSTHALVNETCDEKRFMKIPDAILNEIRLGVHDGLFTAHLEEPNWGIAHRVLMPAFGPLSIRNMFDEMHDICSQMVLKWARQGPEKAILITDDFTRLTLDTIALCSMGFRFNSFYSEQLHPFISSMGEFLVESGRRSQRVPLPIVYRKQDAAFEESIRTMRETAETVLNARVADVESERKDLLTAMLKGTDPKTGQKMTHQSIIDNLITFLIAGHETTSGMLSYAMHRLLRQPEAYKKVQEEVDRVIGHERITVSHMQKLPYISAVLRETLRLDSPIPLFPVSPIEDTLLAGKYPIRKGDVILNFITKSHLDTAVFDRPDEFLPERMLDENFESLPKNAWKPFGNGIRACIGRPFAWQEAVLAMAMIFQNFNFTLNDPDYVLRHKETLTIKPDGLFLHATLRDGIDPVKLEQRLVGAGTNGGSWKSDSSIKLGPDTKSSEGDDAAQMKATILYGSNSGTCESMAQRLACDAPLHGYKVVKLGPMDSAANNLPVNDPEHVVFLVTASYEGLPPDNAEKFVSWVESMKKEGSPFKGLKYAVFGCGHHDWPRTFHRIPNLVDARLNELGGERLAALGLADAASDDIFTVFDTWKDDLLWPAMDSVRTAIKGSLSPSEDLVQRLKVHVSDELSSNIMQGTVQTEVIESRTLTADGEPVKKHIEIALPIKSEYRSGDYLAVLPSNPKHSVLRALKQFKIEWDTIITVEGLSITLPTNVSIHARTVLSDFVELSQPATKKNVLRLAELAGVEADVVALRRLTEENLFSAEISAKRVSVLDLLERHGSIKMDLAEFLQVLPPMRPRQYSISSSPFSNTSTASITFSVVTGKARSGQGNFYGVASSFLASLQAHDPIRISLRPCRNDFHLPPPNENTPLIFVSSGTGIAPFRGFIQERAILAKDGHPMVPAILYHGCREAGKDDLYAEELAEWENMGIIKVRRAYSRLNGQDSEGPIYKYVQDAVWADREELHGLWKKNAKLYICGSRSISQEINRLAIRMKMDLSEQKGQSLSEDEAKEWWGGLRNIRYVADVFD